MVLKNILSQFNKVFIYVVKNFPTLIFVIQRINRQKFVSIIVINFHFIKNVSAPSIFI